MNTNCLRQVWRWINDGNDQRRVLILQQWVIEDGIGWWEDVEISVTEKGSHTCGEHP